MTGTHKTLRMNLAELLSRVLPATREHGAFAAVTVSRTAAECCDAAKATMEHPILLSSAPSLPLPDCSMPDECVCRFRVWPDRRIGERRFTGAANGSPDSDLRARPDRRRPRSDPG